MIKALFLNGVYESVLEEILNSQTKYKNDINYLQPHSTQVISLLKNEQPSIDEPIPVYISTTINLDKICYKGEIVRWEDKGTLSEERLKALNSHIANYQINEVEIYLVNDKREQYRNLISITRLKKLSNFYTTSILTKVNGNTPLKPRTQAGGWAFVYALSDTFESGKPILEEELIAQQDKEVWESLILTSAARTKRLENPVKVSSSFRSKLSILNRSKVSTLFRCKLSSPFRSKLSNQK